MVLIDTSVWIRSFAGREPFFSEVDRILARKESIGHALVYGELLMGDRGGRTRFLEKYMTAPQSALAPHEQVVEMVRARRLHGRGVGWIDVHLLASALVGRMRLWTADPRLAEMAAELGVAYKL